MINNVIETPEGAFWTGSRRGATGYLGWKHGQNDSQRDVIAFDRHAHSYAVDFGYKLHSAEKKYKNFKDKKNA